MSGKKSQMTVELWSIDRFVFDGRNPRKNDPAVGHMFSSIREFGFKVPVSDQSRKGSKILSGQFGSF
jgi:hypothetical protein